MSTVDPFSLNNTWIASHVYVIRIPSIRIGHNCTRAQSSFSVVGSLLRTHPTSMFVCGAWYLCDLQPPQVVAGCGWQCNVRYAYAMLCTTPRRGQQTNSFSDSLLHQTGNDTHSRSMARLVQSGGSVIIRMLSCPSWERVANLHHFLPCFSYPNMKAVCSSSVHYIVK